MGGRGLKKQFLLADFFFPSSSRAGALGGQGLAEYVSFLHLPPELVPWGVRGLKK